MGFKNFLISIIKSLIVLVVATLVFSTVTFDFPQLIKGVFGDIFAYASPEIQKQVVNQLAETCSSLEQGQRVIIINQICTNRSLFDSMKENCRNYIILKKKGVKIEDEDKVRETCLQLESGELERQCNGIQQTSLLPDFSKVGAICSDYRTGKISDKEFFFDVISGVFPSQLEVPRIGFLGGYNQFINYLNNNKILYFVILLILLIILYLLITNIKLFLITLSQISFSLGILIMLPYVMIIVYNLFIGFDTTSILGSMLLQGSVFEPKAILSVILLMFLRTYNSFIITLGITFLGFGVAGKAYSWKLKRQSETIETKTEKKTKKEKKAKVNKEQTKEEIEEAYKHRDRSTKEILDELEEMHKKKSKKD